ncbi:FecCD family ABC transporter permease [Archaeoglobus veneficus]|uniref:ABC-type transporter, integral membrane subunit n=1 Tax=Archaeoglobus veneficus (strain DSM 11195 / SNP6) TaxID=693661 RepID=F2KQ49_ARCVS|nr:iron ABC transporter permease [Archaeoglobus veneficus]AEA47652.1 ABC-type transporter, integral membrane subunit [Archaeoglobus veneficus SNP6]
MRAIVFTLLSFIAVLSLISGILVGSVDAGLGDLMDTLHGKENMKGYIILNVRMPRTLGAFFGGAALAVSGLLLQTYFRNPLAGPYVLGISSAAAFGVALYILAGIGAGYGIVGAAFAGSAIATVLILYIAARVRSAVTLLIAGLMLGYVFSAFERILITLAESEKVHEFVLWTFGSFSGITWDDLRVLFTLSIPVFVLTFLLSKPLNAMLLGEDYARSMGVDVRLLRIAVVATSSFLASLVTAFSGVVAFIGLATPHIARLLFRTSDHRILTPATILLGASIAVLCDVVARALLSPIELPVSVITSIFGAPIVIFLVMRRKRV